MFSIFVRNAHKELYNLTTTGKEFQCRTALGEKLIISEGSLIKGRFGANEICSLQVSIPKIKVRE